MGRTSEPMEGRMLKVRTPTGIQRSRWLAIPPRRIKVDARATIEIVKTIANARVPDPKCAKVQPPMRLPALIAKALHRLYDVKALVRSSGFTSSQIKSREANS